MYGLQTGRAPRIKGREIVEELSGDGLWTVGDKLFPIRVSFTAKMTRSAVIEAPV